MKKITPHSLGSFIYGVIRTNKSISSKISPKEAAYKWISGQTQKFALPIQILVSSTRYVPNNRAADSDHFSKRICE
jgi:hypothetical protein